MIIGSILILLWASLTHYIAYGPLWPISFSLGILGPFSNFAFPWAFTNSFGLPWPNYLILHSWDLWAFHQPLVFLLYYFGPAVVHSCFSTSHNAHEFTTSFSGLLQAHLLSSRPIFLLFGPMIHYSCHSGLMVFFFLINPLTLSYPYCWASSYCWAFPKMSINKKKTQFFKEN